MRNLIVNIHLFFLRRAIARCERFGLVVLDRESLGDAINGLDGFVHGIFGSGALNDGTGRRLHVARKAKARTAMIATLLHKATDFVTFIKNGGKPHRGYLT
jgi:hypothetical protein